MLSVQITKSNMRYYLSVILFKLIKIEQQSVSTITVFCYRSVPFFHTTATKLTTLPPSSTAPQA